MTKQTNKKENQQVVIFGENVENKIHSPQEVVNLLKTRFNNPSSIEVGKVSYYLCALKYYKLSTLSYNDHVLIIKKFFEINGLTTETTTKCQAHYMTKIKKGLVDLSEDFKSSGRAKQVIDLNSIIF